MSGTYKFLHTRDIDKVLRDGTVRIASLAHYRGLEGAPDRIADRLEGSVHIPISHSIILGAGGTDEQALRNTAPQGSRLPIEVSGGAMIGVQGLTLAFPCPEVYIYSASFGDLAELRLSMANGSANSYDAGLRISDIGMLAHRLYYRGRIIEFNSARTRDYFAAVKANNVNYDQLIRAPGMPRLPAPDPFLKDVSFSNQHEIRIALYPRPGKTISYAQLTIRIEDPERLFCEEFRDGGLLRGAA